MGQFELEECPFCGKNSRVVLEYEFGNKVFVVKCKRCGCSRWGRTEKEAVDSWNTRGK